MKFFMLLLLSTSFVVSSVSAQNISQLKSIGKAFTSVAKKSSPMVVFIQTQTERRGLQRPFPGHFFSPGQREQKQLGQGSGFVISSDGHIVTNNHVIAGASSVEVTFLDGKKSIAKVIGRDEHTDIALLKVELKNLPYMTFADSSTVEVGEWVIALGNPFGLSHSLTAGIVSALGRNSVGIANYENFIQTDAAINPGNSGGPLINLEGEAVGMNTAIYSRSGGYMGIGFAIPANMLKNIITQLKDKGGVDRGFLGVSIYDVDSKLKEELGLKVEEGVYVANVGFNTPARRAGIKPEDIIVKLNGETMKSAAVFRNKIASAEPNTKSELEIIREGKSREVLVTLSELPKRGGPRQR